MEKKTKRTKILYTILASLLLVGILPLILIGWQLIKLTRDMLSESVRSHMLSIVVNESAQITLYVDSYKNRVRAIARALEVTGGLRLLQESTVHNFKFGDILREDPNICALMVVYAEGGLGVDNKTFAATNTSKISKEELSLLAKEALQSLEQLPQETFLSLPLLLRSSSLSVITIAHPLTNEFGKLEGAVLAIVQLESVFDFFAQKEPGFHETKDLIKSGKTIYFVVDNKGRVIAHPDRKLVFSGENLRNLRIVEEWLASGLKFTASVPFELLVDDEVVRMLGTYTTANIGAGKELGVIAMVNEDSVYHSVEEMIDRTLLIIGATAIVAVIVGAFLAIRITSPIETLALGARAIAAGDFSRRIRVKTKNEIGQLAEDFNTMADHIQQYVNELRRAAEDNRMLFIGSVRALAEAIDGKDTYTRGHSERVMKYSAIIAKQMGLSDEEVEDIRIAGILHDVGKIGIDDKILKKPAALTDEEYKVMKQHPQIGAKIMSEIPQMKKYIPGMFYHHECLDGHGYPLGLRGEQIPLMARIIAVADVFDAMTTNRPYQKAMETEFALERIKSFVGTRYDGKVVDALIEAFRAGKLDEVLQSYAATQTTAAV
ncbi:MAG: HD domain-containing protein [Acidobacteriota bacterium]|nr:HD domain-containing protein [Blastocatellia bacterium]MDW8413798.1 HD domain-containing protein [Acidobacteriota bacterium]